MSARKQLVWLVEGFEGVAADGTPIPEAPFLGPADEGDERAPEQPAPTLEDYADYGDDRVEPLCRLPGGRVLNYGIVEDAAYWRRLRQLIGERTDGDG